MTRSRDGLVRLIGAFKLVKAVLLIAIGVAALMSLQRQLADFAQHHIAWMGLGLFPGNQHAQRAIGKLKHVDEGTATKFGALALGYAVLFLVEGLGLLAKKRWAEWMTVGVTASFIPIEIYELIKDLTVGKIVALALNIAILVYLIFRRVDERQHVASRLFRAVGAA